MVHTNIAYLNICTKDAIGYTFNINGILFKSNEKLMVDITRETSDIINSKPFELGTSNFDIMATTPSVSHGTCHL